LLEGLIIERKSDIENALPAIKMLLSRCQAGHKLRDVLSSRDAASHCVAKKTRLECFGQGVTSGEYAVVLTIYHSKGTDSLHFFIMKRDH
jgi:hypothetical protein